MRTHAPTAVLTMRFPGLALAGILTCAASASAQCVDWTPGYHVAGIDGVVHALATFDDGTGSGPELTPAASSRSRAT